MKIQKCNIKLIIFQPRFWKSVCWTQCNKISQPLIILDKTWGGRTQPWFWKSRGPKKILTAIVKTPRGAACRGVLNTSLQENTSNEIPLPIPPVQWPLILVSNQENRCTREVNCVSWECEPLFGVFNYMIVICHPDFQHFPIKHGRGK